MATKLKTTTTTTSGNDNGAFVPGLANLALDAADRGQSTAIAVLQDARSELKQFVEHGIDFAEKGASALFRFARTLTKRVDDGVAETLTNAEHLLGNAVKTARETTKAVTDTAGKASTGITAQA